MVHVEFMIRVRFGYVNHRDMPTANDPYSKCIIVFKLQRRSKQNLLKTFSLRLIVNLSRVCHCLSFQLCHVSCVPCAIRKCYRESYAIPANIATNWYLCMHTCPVWMYICVWGCSLVLMFPRVQRVLHFRIFLAYRMHDPQVSENQK